MRGLGRARPNPLVGCVIVKNGIILGEGWHRAYGESHAEVIAVNNVEDKETLKGSTAYVNLEPCSFHGKTPPCADMLSELEIGRVVISNIDPNPKVNGSGIRILESRGVETITGVLENEGEELNKRFFTYHKKGRPYVILKWAQTGDGFLARENFDSKWISNTFSRKLTHKWRSEEHAIMVGTNTARYDNPSLTTRDWAGNNPVRVVIDRKLILDRSLNIFNGETPTICYNEIKAEDNGNLAFVVPENGDFLETVLMDLHGRNIQSVLVEGGATLLQSFISRGLWDEARVFTAKKVFGKGIKAPLLEGIPFSNQVYRNDILNLYTPISNA